MPGGGGDHKSARATFDARAREANVVQLHLRGCRIRTNRPTAGHRQEHGEQGLAIGQSSGFRRPTWRRCARPEASGSSSCGRKLGSDLGWPNLQSRTVVLPSTDQLNDRVTARSEMQQTRGPVLSGLNPATSPSSNRFLQLGAKRYPMRKLIFRRSRD